MYLLGVSEQTFSRDQTYHRSTTALVPASVRFRKHFNCDWCYPISSIFAVAPAPLFVSHYKSIAYINICKVFQRHCYRFLLHNPPSAQFSRQPKHSWVCTLTNIKIVWNKLLVAQHLKCEWEIIKLFCEIVEMLESKTVHNFHHLQGKSYYYRAHFEIYLVMVSHLKGKRNSESNWKRKSRGEPEKPAKRERERKWAGEWVSNIETELFSEKNKKSMTSSNNGKYKIQSWKPQRMQETFQKTLNTTAHGVDL